MIARRLIEPARRIGATLLAEHLAPGRAAAAVFTGVLIALIPIYGFQTLAAIGLAFVFRLNKPITLGATFVNNPVLLPFLVFGSVQAGHLARTGRFLRLTMAEIRAADWKQHVITFFLGGTLLGIVLGAVAAAAVYVYLRRRARAGSNLAGRLRFARRLFDACPWWDRGFVRWKLRLDRIFTLLADEDLGRGTVVDLGCGHGAALAFVASADRGRRLVGCDLDPRRVAAARQAFAGLDADLSVGDVRRLELPPSGLILILDVLQYLDEHEQRALLERCAGALDPGGKLIFRVHDLERGLTSRLSLALDRLIFFAAGAGVRPVMLPAAEYRRVLDAADLAAEERPLRNRLPLAHIVFVAVKPAAGERAP